MTFEHSRETLERMIADRDAWIHAQETALELADDLARAAGCMDGPLMEQFELFLPHSAYVIARAAMAREREEVQT